MGLVKLTGTTGAGTNYTYTYYADGNLKSSKAGTAYYYSDRKFSTVGLINTSGAAATTYTYDPYAATTDTPFRWDGGYQDTEGDNYYHFGARYYDQAGHFTQPDSIKGQASQPRTVDQYAYASGDPINSTDPTGRDSILGSVGDAFGAIGGVLGASGFVDALTELTEVAGEATGATALGLDAVGVGLAAGVVGGLAIGDYIAYRAASS